MTERVAWVCRARAHLDAVAGGRAEQGGVDVEVGGLLDAALVGRARRRQPHDHLQQVCAAPQEMRVSRVLRKHCQKPGFKKAAQVYRCMHVTTCFPECAAHASFIHMQTTGT